MTRLVTLTRICLALMGALSLATPAFALTLPEVLSYLGRRTSVLSALTERQDAEINLSRVQRDPLAVRADLVQAEQRAELASVSLEQVRYSTVSELVSAYTGVLQAEEQLSLAQSGLELSARALDIATIRLTSGSVTQQEQDDAQGAVDEAQNGVRAAREGRDLALSSLSGLLGRAVSPGSLEEVPERFLTPVPPLEQALASAQNHPDLLGVAQQAALARLATEVLDPLYAPQSDIESAASQRQNAQTGLRETQRGFALQVRNLHTQAENARETLSLQTRSLGAERARLATQRQRLAGGLISQLAFEQAALEVQSAALETQSARVAYLSALLELQSGSLVPLTGPFTTLISSSPPNSSIPRSGE